MSAINPGGTRSRSGGRSSVVARPTDRPATDTPRPVKGPVAGAESARIMVVDDDHQIVRLVAQMVAQLGYRSTTAGDALDALFHLNNAHHDLVITDYAMPFMDGVQLADQIKRRYRSTRVIVMTGQSEAVIRDRIKGSTSVDGLLLKPFNLNVMRETIAATIRQV